MNPTWNQLLAVAEAEVRATVASLPGPLRSQARPLPVTYEPHPQPERLHSDYDPDLLGLFIGASRAHPDEHPLPPQIILFLENLWEFSDRDTAIYREEIRTTYLHELGHYLGLEEIDLEERGLE